MFFGCSPCCGSECAKSADYQFPNISSYYVSGTVAYGVSGVANNQPFSEVRTDSPFEMSWAADYVAGGYFPVGSDSVLSTAYQPASLPGTLADYRWNFNVRVLNHTQTSLAVRFEFGELTDAPGSGPTQVDALGTFEYAEERVDINNGRSRGVFTSSNASDANQQLLQFQLSGRQCVQRNTSIAQGYEEFFGFSGSQAFSSYGTSPGIDGECNALPLSIEFAGTSKTVVVFSGAAYTTYVLSISGGFVINQFLWFDDAGNSHQVSQAPFTSPDDTGFITNDGFPVFL